MAEKRKRESGPAVGRPVQWTYGGIAYKSESEMMIEWLRDAIVSGRVRGTLAKIENRSVESITVSNAVEAFNEDIDQSVLIWTSSSGESIPPKMGETRRTRIKNAINGLCEEGLLKKPNKGATACIPDISSKDLIRALLATRDAIDKLAALRLVIAEKIEQAHGKDREDLLIDAKQQLVKQDEIIKALERLITLGTGTEANSNNSLSDGAIEPKLGQIVIRHWMRFIKADTQMHWELGKAANLWFLEHIFFAAHFLPSIIYVRERPQSLTAEGILKNLKKVYKDHEKIIDAIEPMLRMKGKPTVDQMEALGAALDGHLDGNFERWNLMNINKFSFVDPKEFIRLEFPRVGIVLSSDGAAGHVES